MECIFCKIANKEIPSKILYEDDLIIIIMDNNPVVDAHALIIPKKHYTDFLELDENILKHIYKIQKEQSLLIMNKLNAKSMTFTVNYGEQQAVKHFHLHILPNYPGDKNKYSKKDIDENYKLLTG